MTNPPWAKFCPGNRHAREWQAFDEIAHVTHVAPAIAVLEAEAVKPRLVYDESLLRKRRIEVVWLSPNHWYPGYRYGQIAFRFRWADLLIGKQFYWVEAVDYSPKACRFLITDVPRDYLDEYDPETGDGPWRFDPREDEHYFHGGLTMEFMFEGEIPLDACLSTVLVDHHPRMCCLGPSRCTDMDLSRDKAGAELVGAAIGRNLDVRLLNMTRLRKGKTLRSADLMNAADEIMLKIGKIEVRKSGRIDSDDASATAIARALLQAFANRKSKEARLLAEFFVSLDELKVATELLLSRSFDLERVADL